MCWAGGGLTKSSGAASASQYTLYLLYKCQRVTNNHLSAIHKLRYQFLPNGRVSAGCCSFLTVACEMKILRASPHSRVDWSHWTSSKGQKNCGYRLQKKKKNLMLIIIYNMHWDSTRHLLTSNPIKTWGHLRSTSCFLLLGLKHDPCPEHSWDNTKPKPTKKSVFLSRSGNKSQLNKYLTTSLIQKKTVLEDQNISIESSMVQYSCLFLSSC